MELQGRVIGATNIWCYKVEDCADILNTLFPDYNYLFLVDHSCGHDKQREDGLNIENMSKTFGGKQSKMHSTTIKQEKGYLGPYPCTLQVGDIQHMTFQPEDDGPFWLSTAQREQQRSDKIEEGKQQRHNSQRRLDQAACCKRNKCNRYHYQHLKSCKTCCNSNGARNTENFGRMGEQTKRHAAGIVGERLC